MLQPLSHSDMALPTSTLMYDFKMFYDLSLHLVMTPLRCLCPSIFECYECTIRSFCPLSALNIWSFNFQIQYVNITHISYLIFVSFVILPHLKTSPFVLTRIFKNYFYYFYCMWCQKRRSVCKHRYFM